MTSPPTSGFPRRLLIVLALLAEARLAIGGLIPLTDDEAYYRLWAAHLQFGYFDHPPMIAWWIRLGEAVAGQGPLGVRLLPVLSVTLASLLVFDLARRAGGTVRTAERAAIWFNAALLIALGGALATPDAPNILFWVACLACAARATTATKAPANLGWWATAGLAAGLAALSKYSALFLAPGMLLWLAGTAPGRRQLARPGPWVAAAVAVAIFAANIAWNAGHDWVTFVKQFGRAVPEGFSPRHLPELLATQFVLLNPVIALFGARGMGQALRKPGDDVAATRFLLAATCLPFMVYLVLHSLHAQVQGQWPAPLYPAIAVLAALGAQTVSESRRRLADAVAIGLAMLVVGLGVAHVLIPGSDRFGARDPVLMLRGWPAFAAEVEAARVRSGAAWIGVFSYQTKAQLQNALGPTIPVVQILDRARYGGTDSSWRADISRPGLIIDTVRKSDPALLRRCFTRTQSAGALARGAPGGPQQSYPITLVAGPGADLLRTGC